MTLEEFEKMMNALAELVPILRGLVDIPIGGDAGEYLLENINELNCAAGRFLDALAEGNES